jgi:DNA-binding transcriptional LysR family regulator
VQVEVSERGSNQVVEAVQNGNADIGIFNEGPNTHGLRCSPYRTDPLAAVVPPDHPIRGRTVAFADVLAYPLVSLGHTGTLAKLVAEHAAALGVTPRLGLEMKSFQSVCRMVRAGHGVALLPMNTLRDMTASLGLRAVMLSDGWAVRTLRLCARDSAQPRRAVHRLLQHLSRLSEEA